MREENGKGQRRPFACLLYTVVRWFTLGPISGGGGGVWGWCVVVGMGWAADGAGGGVVSGKGTWHGVGRAGREGGAGGSVGVFARPDNFPYCM